jgi:Transposase DDE domain
MRVHPYRDACVASAQDSAESGEFQRAPLVEPIFGDVKHNRGLTRFQRRGRAAVRTEWRLIATTHNIRKLHQHFTAPPA